MGNMSLFDFEGAPVRAVVIDGEPHLVGKDVCDRLGYARASDAMQQHCRGAVKRRPIVDGLGRVQETRVLSEPDVLRLIIASKLPAAERFERWVFEELLPTVRRTGVYAPPGLDAAAILNHPAAMRGLLLTYTEKVLVLEADKAGLKAANAELAPKAGALDLIAVADGSLPITMPPGCCRWPRASGQPA